MTQVTELRTERLLLRQWRESDKAPFVELNADPAVMEHFPSTLSRAESDAFVDRMRDRLDENGWGLWALERLDTGEFIGFTGLVFFADVLPFAPATEVGWRLSRQHWGHGYATEAGRAALDHAFDVLDLDEVVSMTAATNLPSQRVMQRLGMTYDPADDFDHPRAPAGHRTRRHVLYRKRQAG
jgi:RimJ/RimL family protein N-acetyltransferase